MKRFVMTLLSAIGTISMQASEPLTVKDITNGTFSAHYAADIRAIGNTDSYTRISDDGKRIEKYSFRTGEKQSVIFDTEQHTINGTVISIDDYILSPDARKVIIQTNTQKIYRRSFIAEYYIWDTQTNSITQLSENGPQQEPTFSPNGEKIAFVRDNNIFITDGKNESKITTDGEFNKVINGIPDWVNEEEFGFSNAMAWSNDSRMLCWLRYDESNVESYTLQLFKGMKPEHYDYATYPGEYSYKYPKAGERNAIVTAWSYDTSTAKTHKLNIPSDTDSYMPRIKTIPNNSNNILVFTMNRHQDTLRLYNASPLTGASTMVMEETDQRYVREEIIENICITPHHILIPSDRNGHTHLYLYTHQGQLLKQIDKGGHEVADVYGYDEKTGNTYFQAAYPTPMNRALMRVDSKGMIHLLSKDTNGWNSAVYSNNFNYFIKIWSDKETPYQVTICDNKGNELRALTTNTELREKLSEYNLPEKEFFTFTTSEGIKLNGWILKPSDFNEKNKYPLIMHQYSGPGSQQVVDSWRIGSMGQGALFDQLLAQHGFIVACVDGRGTGGRGSDFEKCTYLELGKKESVDQVEAALWLGNMPFIDKERIGIWGWSYGGFNTLMAMSEGRPVFKAGVAIAPPTDWRFYDTIYTERYMRTPAENADGYDTNPINRAKELHGALLLCHGLADDNVHPQNTFEYTEALVQADKDYRQLLFTNRNHSIYGGNTRNYLLRQVLNHFTIQLLNK